MTLRVDVLITWLSDVNSIVVGGTALNLYGLVMFVVPFSSASLLFLWCGNVREEVSCEYNVQLSFLEYLHCEVCFQVLHIENLLK